MGNGPDEAAIDALRRLVNDGYTSNEIATMLGWPRGTVIGRCRRNGIEWKRKRGAATKGKPRKKPDGWVNPSTLSKKERKRREKDALEREGQRQASVADKLAAAADGALHVPLVTVKKGRVVKWRNRAKHPYKPKHYEVEGLGLSKCHFPMTENAPFTFCGKPCRDGSAYCEAHDAICCPGRVPKTECIA